ncbi:4Fe-4S binding protein [Kribbia dieselivorans]|uniref:4Fe-4S binding protein n=1 Tax=Kribbia dieselivorans TaxID=331526 RepID=UPI0008386012|nr:4Fe-4S binding protein [Kribbia dieselivorans]
MTALPPVPSSAHNAIALYAQNCTSCDLCVKECPDRCIHLDFHKETQPATTPRGRDRQVKVLDRFAIDYSLCMYCGICVDVCPFDALFWSPDHTYLGEGEHALTDLLYEKERLGEFLDSAPADPRPKAKVNPFADVRPRGRR